MSRTNFPPVPEDFSERAKNTRNVDLQKHYGVSERVVSAWRALVGLPGMRFGGKQSSGRANTAAPPPKDFEKHARVKTNRELASQFGVGDKTISRWRKETGTTGNIILTRTSAAAIVAASVPSIPQGRAADVAQFLRKTHAPVYDRGRVEGKQFAGTYVVGRQIMTEAEMIAYAEERGYTGYSSIYEMAG